jgi:IS5 family transposase
VKYAQQSPKFKGLHDVLAAVFADPEVQLAVRHDMIPAESQAAWNGCPALPAVVTGCLAVVRRLMGWSYRALAEQVEMSFGWRWVCQIYNQPMPNFRTIRDREALLSPKTVRLLNTKVVLLGRTLGVTTAQQLRLDSSVIETHIHYPTDSSLLADAARVFSRLIVEARQVVKRRADSEQQWFRDRHRQARRLARDIARLASKKAKNAGKSRLKLYAQLIGLVEQVLEQVAYVQTRLATFKSQTVERIQELFNHYRPLVQRVVAQARGRVLDGQQVPATEKLVSLFEPHTSIIVRGKAAPKETEFGHKVWYAEVEGGLISDYRLLHGNPPDAPEVIPSVHHHRRLFGRAPRELSGDRGLYSPENETEARRLGVRRVGLPKSGYKSNTRKRRERQAWFRAAQRFRNGIEGRISQLRRARMLHRCFNHGWAGLERWLGWGIVANNIAIIVMRLNRWHVSLADRLY